MNTPSVSTFLSLLPSFREYWESGYHSSNSVSSYMSYINGAIRMFEKFEPIVDEGIVDKLLHHRLVISKSTKNNKLTENVRLLFLLATKLSNTHLSKKTRSNYSSGIVTYFEFLFAKGYQFEDDSFLVSVTARILKSLPLNGIIFRYTHNKISSNFNSRLNTQDRVYEHVCFPICLINQIISLNPTINRKFKKLKKDKRESTEFIVSLDGKSHVCLSDIFQIEIVPNKKCEISTYSGTICQVYTETDPFDKTKYEPLRAFDLRDLSIDHDVALKNILEEKHFEYRAFLQLGSIIADYYNYRGNDLKTLRSKIVNIDSTTAKDIIRTKGIDVDFANSLFSELEKIYSEMRYVIMYGPYNSKKSDIN